MSVPQNLWMASQRDSLRRFGTCHGYSLAIFGLTSLVGAVALSAAALSTPSAPKGTVTGIGGVFMRAENPDRMIAWYRDMLGMEPDYGTSVDFHWRHSDDPSRPGRTVWAVFPSDSEYFGDRAQPFMVNYRVNGLDALLANLRRKGVEQVGEIKEYDYGRFAWVIDIVGNRIELWEPSRRNPYQ